MEDFNRRVTECVETAEKLLRVDRVTEAVRFLDSQEQEFAKSPRFTEVSTRARDCEQRLQRINNAVQSATSALALQDWDTAQKAIDDCRCTSGEHPELARLATQIVVNRSASATAAVTKATQDCRTLFLARSYEAAIDLLDGVAGSLEYVAEDLRLRYTALHEEAERGVAWTQQQAAFAHEKREDGAPDTAERTSWALDATTRGSTNASAMRKRDLDELQQLAEASSTTGVLDELASISARARVLAERHAGDSQVESTARQVFDTAGARTFSLTATQFGVPGQTLPRQPMVPVPQPPPLAEESASDKPADLAVEPIAIEPPPAPAPPAIIEASATPGKRQSSHLSLHRRNRRRRPQIQFQRRKRHLRRLLLSSLPRPSVANPRLPRFGPKSFPRNCRAGVRISSPAGRIPFQRQPRRISPHPFILPDPSPWCRSRSPSSQNSRSRAWQSRNRPGAQRQSPRCEVDLRAVAAEVPGV